MSMFSKGKLVLLFIFFQHLASAQYDPEYVRLSYLSLGESGDSCSLVDMSRKGERVRVKYFADKDKAGRTVYQRYLAWSKSKSIIAVTSGTYYGKENSNLPVGICMDDGVEINRTREPMDGLAIVYKTGGIVVSNLKEGNLNVRDAKGNNISLNLKNSFDFERFLSWGKENYATVFQTHLLYYRDELQFGEGNSDALRERRLFAAGKGSDGAIHYYIMNIINRNTLYEATRKAMEYFKSHGINPTFILNLDTGAQDYYEVRKSSGSKFTTNGKNRSFLEGALKIEASKNLLVFYFE